MSKLPKLRFREFSGDWESKKLGEFLIESKIKGSTGENSKKLTVKLWGKGIVAKKEILKGSSSTQYYVRKSGQLMYGKLDFLNCAFGIVPKYLDGYESTIDSPAFDVKNANANFLLNKITQKNFYKKYGDIADGSRKAKRVHSETFLNMDINIPSLKEQEKIASFLSLVDEKINLQDKKLENLKNYKKGIMSKIFKRELRFKDNNGNDYPNWEEKKLGEVVECLDNKRKPLNSNERDSIKGNIPYYGANGIVDFINDYIFNEDIILLAEDGGNFDDFATRPIAQFVTGKSWVNNHAHVLRTKYNTKFIFYSLVHKDIRKYINGTSRSKLNKSDMLDIKINLPCLDEQIKISSFLTLIDEKIEKEAKKLDLLNDYKKGLLQKMFV